MSTPGLASLSQQVQQLSQQVAQASGGLGVQPPGSPLMNAILQTQQQMTSAKTEALFDLYKQGLTDAIQNSLGALIEYSVEFVESNAPSLAQMALAFATDTSPFKLTFCVSLIILVLPPTVEIAKELLIDLVNSIVSLKNKLGMSDPPPPVITGQGSLVIASGSPGGLHPPTLSSAIIATSLKKTKSGLWKKLFP